MFPFLRRFLLGNKPPVRIVNRVARPSLTIAQIDFRGGAKLELDEDDIVVVIGPNNVGKSALLKDIKWAMEHRLRGTFINEMRVVKRGSPKDFAGFVESYFERAVYKDDGNRSYQTYGALFKRPDKPEQAWADPQDALGDIFCNLISTEGRLSGSDAPKNFDPREEPPKHPIHLMYLDADLERLVSNYFRSAFGKDLIIYRMGGDKLPLYVGDRPELGEGDDLTSSHYIKEIHDNCVPLSRQGDGVRSYATILTHAFGSIAASVLLLDEPEAFLHPPQARLLAETLSSGNLSVRQFFIATHSAEVLAGLLSTQSKNVKIVKLGRSAELLDVHVLDRVKTAKIARDPLLRYSGVLGAVFHRRTFVCEGDSDCLFYNAILDVPAVRSDTASDALFIHAGGKHRIPQLLSALKTLDVRFDVICDIDVLREEKLLKDLVVEAGGDWGAVEKIWKPFSADLNAMKKDISDDLIISTLNDLIEGARDDGKLDDNVRSRIRQALSPMSIWDDVKAGGVQALPAGNATERFQLLQEALAHLKIWIVPVGTLEGFCKSVPGKTGWAQRVLDTKELDSEPELQTARDFVKMIWSSGPRVEVQQHNGSSLTEELLPILDDSDIEESDDDSPMPRHSERRPFRPSPYAREHKRIR